MTASLISFEEALALGELTDHEEIGGVVERAWQVRRENFGDSTDMCSLVNAKSGGCAEDCGFCAQSRYAEADTPMHAMMEPEQILEHAKAAEAAGAHRFCMVTQGQGLSKRDFEKILAGAKLVAEGTNLKRCASIGHMSAERARKLREAGIQRVHHNVESARSYYPEVSTTVRYEGRLRTIDAVKEAGLETCVGGILNLGESPRQRVEMAFELAELKPTSVPINLLNPREGTKFGERPLMDAWEVVKWVAIFRLIIPGALFRLCGGRVENLGDLQPLAVKAGLNGVMMGNFLTTLGAEPEDDRAMFEELGLNVARQPDSDRFRLWEVAGTAHADAHLLGSNVQYIECGVPINNGALHVVAKAGLRALTTWIESGKVPPKAPRIDVASGPSPQIQRNADGIALGGIRTPPVDAPVAALSGAPGPNPSVICLLLGSTNPISPERLAELYPSRAVYQQRYDRAADAAIKAGFVLPEDRAALLAFAEPSTIPG